MFLLDNMRPCNYPAGIQKFIRLESTLTVLLRLMLRIPPPICEALFVTSPQLRVHDWYAAITLTAYQLGHSLCRLQPRFGGSTHIRWLADATLFLDIRMLEGNVYGSCCDNQMCHIQYGFVRAISESANLGALDYHQLSVRDALHTLHTGTRYARMQIVLHDIDAPL